MKIYVFLERKVTLVSINMCLVQSCVACSLAKATWSNSLQVVFKLRVPTLWTITLSMTTGARGHRNFYPFFIVFEARLLFNDRTINAQLLNSSSAKKLWFSSFSATLWNLKPLKNHQTTKRCLFSGCNKPQRLRSRLQVGFIKAYHADLRIWYLVVKLEVFHGTFACWTWKMVESGCFVKRLGHC